MAKTERNYASFKANTLSNVFSLIIFCVYLLSNQLFVIITNHMALKCAFQMLDVHGHILRCFDLLAEHDFAIEYWSCCKNGAADFLWCPFMALWWKKRMSTNEPEIKGVACFTKSQLADALKPFLCQLIFFPTTKTSAITTQKQEPISGDMRRTWWHRTKIYFAKSKKLCLRVVQSHSDHV